MAIDNLNFYSNGLPAGQQTDKYSSQPGCLRSKNLDIFSSSKSVKATAWSTPVNTAESGVVLVDQTGNLILKSDGNVYDRSSGTEVLVKSGIASNFPTYQVSYNGQRGTYADAQWGTPKQLLSKYENGVLKYFTIFTDRARYFYSAEEYRVTHDDEKYTLNGWAAASSNMNGYWKKDGTSATSSIRFKINNLKGLTKAQLLIQAENEYHYAEEGHITINSITVDNPRYWYNDETGQMEYYFSTSSTTLTGYEQLDDSTGKTVYVDIPLFPVDDDHDYFLTISLKHTYGTDNTHTWTHGRIQTNILGYHDGYNYLPVDSNRYLEDVGEYYWEKGVSNQTLYSWNGEWVNDSNYQRVVRYNLVKYMAWANDVSMDVVGMTVWNEQVYMIGNMDGNGYIIPCDLSGGRGTPFISYGCTFRGVANIDYLLYLVGEDRGISQLWVYNGQELVPPLGGNKENNLTDYVDTAEQYKFDGKMVEYRGDLVLTTSDNRVFQYGQTYGGKGGSFIHQLPGEIKGLKTKGNDLIVKFGGVTRATQPYTDPGLIPASDEFDISIYSEDGQTEVAALHMMGNTKVSEIISTYGGTYNFSYLSDTLDGDKLDPRVYITQYDQDTYYIVSDTYESCTSVYQDDVVAKNYNTEWEAEYPIVLGNHLLEKEESDLYASYILPNSSCKLEFWGMANHYHFWTFKSSDSYTFSTTADYKMKGCTGNYKLKFIEKNDNYYTFRLEGDLPLQTVSGMKITDTEGTELITYSDYNHFRKIGEITTDGYQEGEFRFHNLNNKLELPKSHSLQIMVRGKGTANYTPELFAVDLVANQRDRG